MSSCFTWSWNALQLGSTNWAGAQVTQFDCRRKERSAETDLGCVTTSQVASACFVVRLLTGGKMDPSPGNFKDNLSSENDAGTTAQMPRCSQA